MGERGCGKTTLVRLLSGLCRPTSGECTVLGLSPSHEPQRLHSVAGTVLDSAHLYTGMTLYENLHFFAGLHGLDDNDALERSSFLLHKLDIWEGRDLPVEKLSTGVVRRASLARALMHRRPRPGDRPGHPGAAHLCGRGGGRHPVPVQLEYALCPAAVPELRHPPTRRAAGPGGFGKPAHRRGSELPCLSAPGGGQPRPRWLPLERRLLGAGD